MQPILTTRHLTRTFGHGRTQVRAVDNVSVRFAAGELALITGPSGSGKTTLLSMFGALLRPSSGQIVVNGDDLTTIEKKRLPGIRARHIGFVFQAFHLLDALSVEDNILFPARLIGGGLHTARDRCYALMDQLGLMSRRRHRPQTLSGGEKQRVAIARALINAPPLILADEPTGNLDSATGQEVMMILHDAARDHGHTVILVTHDPRVEEIADRILWLEDGALRDRDPGQRQWVRDPVCGMRVDAATARARTVHAGLTHVFCSFRCRDRFLTHPSRYLTGARGPV